MRATKQSAKYTWGITVIAMLFCMATLTATNTNAQVIGTDPAGYIVYSNTASGYTYMSLALTQLPQQRGYISAVISNATTTLTDSSATWTNNQFSAIVPSYFVEITSGAYAGLMDDIVATAGGFPNATITTAHNLVAMTGGTANLVGQTYKIYPHWTLNSVFGPPTQSGLQGGTTASAADNVLLWNSTLQNVPSSAVYWYRTNGTSPGWRSSVNTVTDCGTNVLYLDQGIVVQRKTSSPANTPLTLVGGVKLGQTISPVVASGYTYCGTVYAAPYTLNSTILYTTNSATGVAGGTTASAADNVLVWNVTSQSVPSSQVYWFRTNGTSPGWRSSVNTVTDCGTNLMPIGTILQVQRKTSSGFNWYMPPLY